MFCAVLGWSPVRFLRFATDEKATTTLALLAECFEVSAVSRRSSWPTRWAARRAQRSPTVVVTADYVRFAAHYRFRPDFCGRLWLVRVEANAVHEERVVAAGNSYPWSGLRRWVSSPAAVVTQARPRADVAPSWQRPSGRRR